MRELLDGLAAAPDQPRPFPQIEDRIGWPRRRIASVLGGVCRLRQREFGGRRPYRFQDTRQSASGRWEMWMDALQADAVRRAPRAVSRRRRRELRRAGAVRSTMALARSTPREGCQREGEQSTHACSV